MAFRVFHCFYASDDHVPAESAVSMTVDDVIGELLPRLESEGDFIGLLDSAGTAFQIMYEDAASRGPAKRVRVDIPAPHEGGSYGQEIRLPEVAGLLRGLGAAIHPASVPGLVFEAW